MEMERMRALVLAKPKKAARGKLYAFLGCGCSS